MKKRYVIYSAMVGAYDEIRQPLVVDERFDYVLFSNEIQSSNVGVWQVRKIDYSNSDNTRICRYVKTHPETLLAGYVFSVWMDSNIQICTDYIYRRTIELFDYGVLVSSTYHPGWDCIYTEAVQLIYMGVEHEDMVLRWCHRLRKEGYPQHNGLCETAILFRVMDARIKELDELWWNCIDAFSRRDQLSFNYALWKLAVPVHYLMGIGKSAKNMDDFIVLVHKDSIKNNCPLKSHEAWMVRYLRKNPDEMKIIEKTYYKIFNTINPQLVARIMGQYYRLKHLLATI